MRARAAKPVAVASLRRDRFRTRVVSWERVGDLWERIAPLPWDTWPNDYFDPSATRADYFDLPPLDEVFTVECYPAAPEPEPFPPLRPFRWLP